MEEDFWTKVGEFFAAHGWAIVNAIIALVVGYLVIKLLIVIINRMLKKTRLAPITQGFLRSVLKVVLYVMLVFIVLQILGIPITGLATVLATAGVAIALALKDSLANVAYGLIIISTKPFYQGDYVAIAGQEGSVKEIGIMSTQLVTLDNKKVVIPNSNVYGSAIVNYTARGSRRMDINFDVAYETDLELAKKVIIKVCESNGKIMLSPAPEVHLKYFQSSNVTLFLTCWTNGPYWEIYYYIMDNVYNEFKRNKITVAYEQIEVRMRDDDVIMPYNKASLPKRVEVKPADKESFSLLEIKEVNKIREKTRQKMLKFLENKRKKIDAQILQIKSKDKNLNSGKLKSNNLVIIKSKNRVVKSPIHPILNLGKKQDKEE